MDWISVPYTDVTDGQFSPHMSSLVMGMVPETDMDSVACFLINFL